jgi:hypothetical protein
VFILLVLLSLPSQAQQKVQRRHIEQSHFGAEVEVRHPVKVPQAVLNILILDKRNQSCLNNGEPIHKIPASWFVGSEIHLDDDSLPDLVVTAVNACLFGANLVPFWIFRKTSEGYELLLSTNALGLDVLNARSRGLRSIRATAATARRVSRVVYMFDGSKYRKRYP